MSCLFNQSYACFSGNYFVLESIRRQEKITGKQITFCEVNLLDKNALEEVFQKVCLYFIFHQVFLWHN